MIETEVNIREEIYKYLQQVYPESNGKPGLYIGPELDVPFCLNLSFVLNESVLTRGAFNFIIIDQDLKGALDEKLKYWLSEKGRLFYTNRAVRP